MPLSLHPVLDRRALVNGAWWPYSRDAAAELPGLIAAVDQRLGRTTLRVGLYREAWQYIPRRNPARGRQVRIGSFRHTDPLAITSIFAAGEPVVLLIMLSDTTAGPAEVTLKLTAPDTTRSTADDLLASAHLPPEPASHAPVTDGSERWEDEGGAVTGQEAPSLIGLRPASA